MDKKYLVFEELEAKPKTKQYAVNNVSGEVLGYIQWYAKWRKYCFFPKTLPLIFDAICLSEIKEFLETLMNERKQGIKK
jgi:hypothetical protein